MELIMQLKNEYNVALMREFIIFNRWYIADLL
jgi:hypothetical protein